MKALSFDRHRRAFLAATAKGSGAWLTLTQCGALSRLAFAAPVVPANELLVVLFLRGGADALNLCAPVTDGDYIAARPPELRIPKDGPKAGLAVPAVFANRDDFRLHATARGLQELMNGGHLALIHAAGIVNDTRSHFEAQELVERGLERFGNSPGSEGGWLARWLVDAAAAPLAAVSIGTRTDPALSGLARSLAFGDMARSLSVGGGEPMLSVLASLNSGSDTPAAVAGRNYLDAFRLLKAKLVALQGSGAQSADRPPKAAYDASDLGLGLRTLGALIKADVPLRVACLDMSGWDTHEQQSGRFERLVGTLSANLATFWDDIAPRRGHITVLALSEFGRRLRSNKSGGTDHGHGGAVLVLSTHLQRGGVFGTWPGLDRNHLDRSVDLAVTTDWRAVAREVLAVRLAASPEKLQAVFPGLAPSTSLGLFKPG